EIYGEMYSAIDAMRLAADAGLTGSDSRAWALYNLGNLYLRVGKLDTAAFIYNGILEERPGYANAYNGLAKIMVVKGNYKQGVEYLFTASQISPDHAFIEELAEIYRLSGNKESENVMIAEVLKEFEEHESDGWNIKREFAKFCAIHNINLEEALEGLESEYETSPTSIEVIHLYALLLSKNYQTEKSMTVIQEAMKLGTYNPVIDYHAGMIFEAAGRNKEALNYFQTSLGENLFIHPLYFEDARSRIASLQMVVSVQ
ncbi:MAG: tetratricopeptide repeat protein, partial [Ignavibacteria bacterium]|nr:tetratricopeptide repeat protein [Ignavibacteria bacterium]